MIALDLDPKDLEAREMLGQLYLAQNKFIDAELVFKELKILDPDNLDYLFTLADLARLQKKLGFGN
jgi:hypothetical protein